MTCQICNGPVPPKAPGRPGPQAKFCSKRCRRDQDILDQKKSRAKRRLGMKRHAEPRRGREPTIKALERARPKNKQGTRTTAEEAAAAGWPTPALVLHGLPLYYCPAYDIRMTAEHCAFNRRVARGQVEADGAMLGKWSATLEIRQGTATSLYQDEIDCRQKSCGGCPGVLALAERPDLAPPSVRTATPMLAAAQRGVGLVDAMGEWGDL